MRAAVNIEAFASGQQLIASERVGAERRTRSNALTTPGFALAALRFFLLDAAWQDSCEDAVPVDASVTDSAGSVPPRFIVAACTEPTIMQLVPAHQSVNAIARTLDMFFPKGTSEVYSRDLRVVESAAGLSRNYLRQAVPVGCFA